MPNSTSGGSCQLGLISYKVLAGETVVSISQKFSTTPQYLSLANPRIDLSKLSSGMEICVPKLKQQVPPCPIGSQPYVIKKGDTLTKIAKTFNTSIQNILDTNKNVNPNLLKEGQIICIFDESTQGSKCPSSNSYVVKLGDTLFSIAKAFGITTTQLLNANPTLAANSLIVGTVICIPIAPTPFSIVVRIPTKTLDLYMLGLFVKTYSVAVGKPLTPSPIGIFTIINKQVNPGGPFGTRWMGISEPHYGIHGTNKPSSIGTAASNGCIRMYNMDIEELFGIVPVGTVVRIF